MYHLFDPSFIQSVQSLRTPFLDRFFIFCNFFDTATFAILLILSIGVFVNRKMGIRLAFILILSALVNKALKYTFGMPRPHDIEPALGILTANTPGFPSGAAQNSLLLCGILIKEWSNPLKWIVGPLYVVVISFSRMYLGLHFPIDLIGGFVSGILLLSVYLLFSHKKTGVILMASTAAAALAGSSAHGALYSGQGLEAALPDYQYAPHSFVIQNGQRYEEWTADDHRESYKVMMSAAHHFESRPFLVYGEEHIGSSEPHRWHFVPYQTTSNVVSRYWQQLQVAVRVIFGGTSVDEQMETDQSASFEGAFDHMEDTLPEHSTGEKSRDPFCNDEVVEKQTVIEGKQVRVLYDIRPVGDTHFLIVPKAHRRDFRQLTEEEYAEAAQLSQFVIRKLRENQPTANVYMMHKTQLDAGQSIPHWHFHLITTDTPRSDFWSKAGFLWRMTFGAARLDNDELARRVGLYKRIFDS